MNMRNTKIIIPLLFALAWGSNGPVRAQAIDYAQMAESPVWQLRYSSVDGFKLPTPESKQVLEKLAMDPHPYVARQAFAVYERMFIDVKPEVIDEAFKRGEFNLMYCFSSPDLRDPLTWIFRIKILESPTNEIRKVGIFGDKFDAAILTELIDEEDVDTLMYLAGAYGRLGAEQEYLDTIDKILELPLVGNIHYQNLCVDYLFQTHPDRAVAAWQQIDEKLKEFPDLQPNWYLGHALQKTLFDHQQEAKREER